MKPHYAVVSPIDDEAPILAYPMRQSQSIQYKMPKRQAKQGNIVKGGKLSAFSGSRHSKNKSQIAQKLVLNGSKLEFVGSELMLRNQMLRDSVEKPN